MPMGALADTFERLRQAGPDDFYTGETARLLVADLQAGGSAIAAADFAGYSARIVDPIVRERAGHTLNLVPGYSAGPTFAGALGRLPERFATAAPDAATYRSEEHTSELQSLMRISYAVFCLKKK